MQPRGIRNNNPGNIEYITTNDWQGQTGTDGRYAIFEEPIYGIRAMARVLQNYRLRGIDTVETIIETWAPSTENDTNSYIESVCMRAGVASDKILAKSDLPKVIAAMIYHENGEQPYDMNLIETAIERAQQ